MLQKQNQEDNVVLANIYKLRSSHGKLRPINMGYITKNEVVLTEDLYQEVNYGFNNRTLTVTLLEVSGAMAYRAHHNV